LLVPRCMLSLKCASSDPTGAENLRTCSSLWSGTRRPPHTARTSTSPSGRRAGGGRPGSVHELKMACAIFEGTGLTASRRRDRLVHNKPDRQTLLISMCRRGAGAAMLAGVAACALWCMPCDAHGTMTAPTPRQPEPLYWFQVARAHAECALHGRRARACARARVRVCACATGRAWRRASDASASDASGAVDVCLHACAPRWGASSDARVPARAKRCTRPLRGMGGLVRSGEDLLPWRTACARWCVVCACLRRFPCAGTHALTSKTHAAVSL